MKKVLAIFAILALASCGNGKSTEVISDSTAVAVDSVLVDSAAVSVDSVKAEVPAVEVK
jgi:uncharacterized lipoprotein YajG